MTGRASMDEFGASNVMERAKLPAARLRPSPGQGLGFPLGSRGDRGSWPGIRVSKTFDDALVPVARPAVRRSGHLAGLDALLSSQGVRIYHGHDDPGLCSSGWSRWAQTRTRNRTACRRADGFAGAPMQAGDGPDAKERQATAAVAGVSAALTKAVPGWRCRGQWP